MNPSGSKTKVLSVILSVLLSISEAGHSSYCQIWQTDIKKSENSVKVSQNYKGLWLSQKCEIHPGPRFVLRRYHFSRGDGNFNLIRYYYLDPWCTAASFSVTAAGSFSPPPEKATSSSHSWVVPGGLELDFVLKRVAIVPFTFKAAHELSVKVNSSCPNIITNQWKPFKKYKVLNYERQRKQNFKRNAESLNDFDCTASLDFNFNELLLMRFEHRTPLRLFSFKDISMESSELSSRYSAYLFLGAEDTHRPTYYQEPLVSAKTAHCPTCRSLSKSAPASPPILSISYDSRPLDTGLEGQWISLRCEVRPYGLFLRRVFVFGGLDRSWKAEHSYYKDPQCKSPMFTLSAKGAYYRGDLSSVVTDAVDYDFHITESSLVPNDKLFVNNLNGLQTCGPGASWKVGVEGNLTTSGGCKELGIIVPSVEQDLVRFEKLRTDVVYLYLGETTGDRTRPTSFQPPLIRCSFPEEHNEENYLFNYNELQPLPLVSGSSSLKDHYLIFYIWILSFHCYFFYLYHFDIKN